MWVNNIKSCEAVRHLIAAKKTNFIQDIETGTCVITGGTSGLGKELATQLALIGGHVIIACRSSYRGKAVQDEIEEIVKKEGASGKVEYLLCDLASLTSTKRFIFELLRKLNEHEIPTLKLLVLNAGIKPSGSRRYVTWQGFEKTFQVNFLSQFFIFTQLEQHLKEGFRNGQHAGKVVFVVAKEGVTGPFCTSDLSNCENIMRHVVKPQYVENYNSEQTYATTKLCGIMAANYINETCQEEGIVACSVYPGLIYETELRRDQFFARLRTRIMTNFDYTVNSGTAHILNVCLLTTEELRGQYFDKFQTRNLPPIATTLGAQKSLFITCSTLLKQFLKSERDYQLRLDRGEGEDNLLDNPMLRQLYKLLRREDTHDNETENQDIEPDNY